MSNKKKSKVKDSVSKTDPSAEEDGVTIEEVRRATLALSRFKPKVPFSYLVATRDAIKEKNSGF